MTALLLLALLGTGQARPQAEPAYRTCPEFVGLPDGAQRLSVVWISPLNRRALPRARLTVVPTRTLRTWINERDADVPRLLAGLGLRKPQRRIRRPWKAVIFEVDADQLCRPTEGLAPTERASDGALTCPHGARGIRARHDHCGRLVDLVSAKPSLPAYHTRWRDASTRGFCVLPLERFVRGD